MVYVEHQWGCFRNSGLASIPGVFVVLNRNSVSRLDSLGHGIDLGPLELRMWYIDLKILVLGRNPSI